MCWLGCIQIDVLSDGMGKRTTKGTVHDGPHYPRKRLYRARAHGNPLNDAVFAVPAAPEDVNWREYFPSGDDVPSPVQFLDVGCGYGGLTVKSVNNFTEGVK